MTRILKYTLQDHGEAVVQIPRSATVLSAGEQSGALQIWALVGAETPLESRAFSVVYTGFDEVPPRGCFIGTVVSAGGAIVRHVYEIETEGKTADPKMWDKEFASDDGRFEPPFDPAEAGF